MNRQDRQWQRSFWFIAILSYWLGSSLLHLQFSLLIVSPLKTPFGEFRPADYSFMAGCILAVLLVVFLVFRTVYGTYRIRTLSYWALWFLGIYVTDRYLIFVPNEYIHYPQYALLSLGLAWYWDPHRREWPIARVLFWATLLGIIDEILQYLFICPTYGKYLDFNDFLLNELGVAAGILLYYGFQNPPEAKRPPRPLFHTLCRSLEFKVSLACTVLIMGLLWTGLVQVTTQQKIPPGGIGPWNGKKALYLERKPGIYGNWNLLGTHRAYVLSPTAGLATLLVTGVFFATFDPRPLQPLWARAFPFRRKRMG